MSSISNLSNGYSLIDLGYRDYIAARVLLNNHLIIQGLTLASTAVEKYLKAAIVLASNGNEKYNVHLDNFAKLKGILVKNNLKFIDKLDPVFMEILRDVYRIRYYDRLKNPIFIGLYINQFIGELDWTVEFFETTVFQTQMTPYWQAVKKKDPNLFDNNYILNGTAKKEYMERADIGFSVFVRVSSAVWEEKVVKGGSVENKYEGVIGRFSEFGPEEFPGRFPKV